MQFTLVVTPRTNIDEKTGKLIDKDMKGYLIRSETIQIPTRMPVFDENNQLMGHKEGSELKTLCEVSWLGKLPAIISPLEKLYVEDLVLIGQENSVADLIEVMNELTDRVATLEGMLAEEVDEDSDDAEYTEMEEANA